MRERLFYRTPASRWEEALPIGNGRLGAMVFGDPISERLQLNEDSLWYGGPRDRHNPDALKHLPDIRRLIFAGKLREAERLASLALTAVPETQRHYVPLGDLFLPPEIGCGRRYRSNTCEIKQVHCQRSFLVPFPPGLRRPRVWR